MEINAQTSITFHGIDPLCVKDPIQFSKAAAQNLLRNRRVVIMGCNVQRDLYKDIVLLLQEERYLSNKENRVKGAKTVVNDKLIKKSEIVKKVKNDPHYREVREYREKDFHIRFYFITRAYNAIVSHYISNMRDDEFEPDIVMFNSTVWDICKYGVPFDESLFKENVTNVCRQLKEFSNCQLIWLHQPPVRSNCSSRYIDDAAIRDELRTNVEKWVCKAVNIAEQVRQKHELLSIDLYNLMKHRTCKLLAKDETHWTSEGYRCMTLLILHKLSKVLNVPLPSESVTYVSPPEEAELN